MTGIFEPPVSPQLEEPWLKEKPTSFFQNWDWQKLARNPERSKSLAEKSKLTFGVEFEFALVALDFTETEDPDPEGGRTVYGIDYVTRTVNGKKTFVREDPSSYAPASSKDNKNDKASDQDSGFEELSTVVNSWKVSEVKDPEFGWELEEVHPQHLLWQQTDDTPEQRAKEASWRCSLGPSTTACTVAENNKEKEKGTSMYHAQMHIANTLRKANFSAITGGDVAKSIELQEQSHKYWVITEDSSIWPPDNLDHQRYTVYGIEITSPAYEFNQQSVKAVEEVCKLLTSTYRINCNESCGLHVHVGNGSKGFEHEVVRNLFATLWTFEPQLNTIHPEHRLTNEIYCHNLRTESFLAQVCLSLRERLRILLRTQAIYEVADLQETPGHWYKSAYRTSFLRQPYEHAYKRTVEFRQHESTLDPERVRNWIELCTGLVAFAGNISKTELEKLLEKKIDLSVQKFPLKSVLKALKMPAQASFYGRRLQENRESKMKKVAVESPSDALKKCLIRALKE